MNVPVSCPHCGVLFDLSYFPYYCTGCKGSLWPNAISVPERLIRKALAFEAVRNIGDGGHLEDTIREQTRAIADLLAFVTYEEPTT